MDFTYRENYWDSTELKSEYIDFINLIHRVDLSAWNERGFWDQGYRPFSFFDGDMLVSSVCIYSMNMVINDAQRKVAQVSGVGTLSEYRRRGLSSELTERALDWARREHDFFYLFADDAAISFYRKRGFRPVVESKTRISVTPGPRRRGAIKLDVENEDHLGLMYRIACERVSVSDSLGVLNPKLLMFWLLNFLKDCIYHIPELDILVLCKSADGVTTIYDIVGRLLPSFSEIQPYVRSESDEAVEFLFMTDKLNLENSEQIAVDDGETHVLGEFPLEGARFIIPFTAKA